MAGDVDNPRIWFNADVYTASVGTTAPDDIDTPWSGSWDALGLLSEDDGMVESRSDDTADHYAWGGILVRTTKSKHKRTIKVTALEDNPIVWALRNPGSSAATDTGITTRTVKVPQPDPRAFGFETRDGDIVRRRIVPKGEIVEIGDVTSSDSDMEMYELTINVYPAADGTLYVDITNDAQAIES